MGMAAYGAPKYIDKVWEVVHQSGDGAFSLNPMYFSMHYSTKYSYTRKFENLFGKPRDPRIEFVTTVTELDKDLSERADDRDDLCKYNQYYADIAASIQSVTEELIVNLANEVYRLTGSKHLCLAGGVALNSVANARIWQETPFDELYIQPSAGDGGGALGAALYTWHTILGNDRRFVMDHAYWGSSFTQDQIHLELTRRGLKFQRIDDDTKLVEMSVDRLVSGKVIGLFQGRSEWGPRALGNRSIIADPRNSGMKDVVNNKIKFREPFRPFAPAVTIENSQAYFDIPVPERNFLARFMLMVVPVQSNKQDVIPAVNHMGTARVQTVFQDNSPFYYDLINTFGSATGVPVLLNTSFNVAGEPMVDSPKDAINTFTSSGIDSLVLGNFILDKTDLGS